KGDVQPEDVLTPAEMRTLKTEVEQEIYNEITGRNRITDEMRHFARNWDFSAALDTLGLRQIEKRERCEDELILICVVNKLARLAEAQETPGRKARAFQLAPGWQRRRRQEQKLFWRKRQRLWRKVRNADKKLAEQALWLWKRQALRLWEQGLCLPQSLEQEAARILGHLPSSTDDLALLQKMQGVRPGKYESWALRNTIHA